MQTPKISIERHYPINKWMKSIEKKINQLYYLLISTTYLDDYLYQKIKIRNYG